MKFLIVFLRISFTLCCIGLSPLGAADRHNQQNQVNKPYVLLISIDGFRHDYFRKYTPKNLQLFQKQGSSAKALIPVYPSVTFTNHYSIATGLYGENHGLVGNHFYDPDRKKQYSMLNNSTVVDGTWYFGTPIWVSAEKQGMLSACFFWPGSEANIQGVYPTYYKAFDKEISLEQRVSQIIGWLRLPEENRPHFLTLYYSLVDSETHEYGVDSPQVKDAVAKIDDSLGDLFSKIEALKLPMNIIIVSDHGMTNADEDKIVYLEKYVDFSNLIYVDGGTNVSLFLPAGVSEAALIQKLRKNLPKQVHVYPRNKLPKALHIKGTRRIGDILVYADPPYSVRSQKNQKPFRKGTHGYMHSFTDMHGIFLARGPNIKVGLSLPPLENIHIHPLIMRILGLKIADKVDGTFSRLAEIYKK